ncbi:MAG: threonine--tRNA ligase [Patescibacteria group bacterium]
MTNNQLEKIRHSLSHLLAMAVLDIIPDAKLAIGPVIDNGFYYDFDLPRALTPQDLPQIEKRMKKMIGQNIPFVRLARSFVEAKQLSVGQPYKLELIADLEKNNQPISYYQSGKFTDLCAGPHVASSKELNADSFKLTSIAGAYWRGDEKNKMLQRIYGVAFGSKKELDEYLFKLKEAEKRDHRTIGKELDLFMFNEEVGQGLPLWLPKGALLRKIIMDFTFNTYLERGYEPVSTPHISSMKLWGHSGHVDFYKDSLYEPFGIDEEEYMLKPMNCPMHVQMYNRKKWSYRDLPVRWAEMGTVYRYEKSGTLHGLTRVRGFTQDDAHIICTPEQLHSEIAAAVKLSQYILKIFGFKKFEVNLSVRDPKHKEKFIGEEKRWNWAEETLKKVLNEMKLPFVIDEGGAVFYGPKIDIKVNDALDRPWQLSTIQFDFNLPSRFNMEYQGSDGAQHVPYMVHRALLGSVERFIGVLIEHYAGAFPVWLSPVQVQILTVGKAHQRFGKKLHEELLKSGIRSYLDDNNDTVGYKIRQAEKQKVPYMLVIGDKEMKGKSLAVRLRGDKLIKKISLKKFIKQIQKEITEKK